MWNGLAVCDRYITETCVYILFDAGLCLVRDILMDFDYCFIFKGEARMYRHVGWVLPPLEAVMGGSSYVHTYMSVAISRATYHCL